MSSLAVSSSRLYVDLDRDTVDLCRRIPDLVGEVHGLEPDHLAFGPDGHEILLASHDERRDADLAALLHCRSQQHVGTAGLLALRAQVVRGAVEDGVDLVEVHEVGDRDLATASGLYGLELFGTHDHERAVA